MSTVLNECLDSVRAIIQTPNSGDYCLSGGASGADTYWSILASNAGMDSIHYSFEDHKKYCKDAVGMRMIVSQERLMLADPSLKKANKTVGRNFPCRSNHVNSLLRRNYYQIVDSHSCYAVSRLLHGAVDGGTAWATQMFIDKHMERSPFGSCPCWVYDTITNQWFQWVYDTWQECDASMVPRPSGIWTGIGSRELTPEAKKAMEAIWHNHPLT